MTKEEVLKYSSTPLSLGSNPIPPTAHRFMNREHLYIIYKTDWDALRKVVPEPLELLDEPLVRFEMMRMPIATGYGDYTECGQAIPVVCNGVEGEYLHQMYLDNFEAMASGREAHAYPKKPGHPEFYIDDNTVVGTLDYGRSHPFRIANATMTYKYYPLDEAEALHQMTEPTYMLKLLPGYDESKGPRIAELIVAQTDPKDVEIIEAWTGDARLQLFDHVKCPMNDLPVREIVSCSHIKCNLTLGFPKVVYDYLQQK